LGDLDGDAGWDADAWRAALEAYWDEHAVIRTDADARGPGLVIIDTEGTARGTWSVRQILHDPDGFHDWSIRAEVDLGGSDEAGEAVVRLVDVSML
jgi:hypothetical protein